MTKNNLANMDPAKCKKVVETKAFQYFCQKELPRLQEKSLQNQFNQLKSNADKIRNLEQRIKRLEEV